MSADERITLDEYRRRAALGEFSGSQGVELLEGTLVPKARQSLKHEGALEKIQELLGKLVPEGWQLRVQQPIRVLDSQPEPDVAIVRKTLDDYAGRAPEPEDVALVFEAADASLAVDRRLKGRVYARAGIVSYWLLDLLDNQLEVYTNPSGPVQMPGYQENRVYRAEDKLSLVIGLDDLGMVRVADMIP
jgi:hypothetical protein